MKSNFFGYFVFRELYPRFKYFIFLNFFSWGFIFNGNFFQRYFLQRCILGYFVIGHFFTDSILIKKKKTVKIKINEA